MNQKQVQDALLGYLGGALATAYPDLVLTHSFEDAISRYESGAGWILITLASLEHDAPVMDADSWSFTLQMSKSLQMGAQETTTTATDADQTLVSDVFASISSREGYVALRELGLCRAAIVAGVEDQQSESTINPHTFSCATF